MTAQMPEKLFYKGEEYGIEIEPLGDLLSKSDILRPGDWSHWSSCWRGYIGSWEIEDNKLYLVGLEGDADKESTDLNYVFPNQEKVFASWFSGQIRLGLGKYLGSEHMFYGSIYEKDLVLTLEDGVVTHEEEFDNSDVEKAKIRRKVIFWDVPLDVLKQEAENGNPEAQSYLGFRYFHGKDICKDDEGVPQDYTEAVKWYRKAAEQGHAHAQFCLGECYFFGNGVPNDEKEALKWLRVASEQRNIMAQEFLDAWHLVSLGIPEDKIERIEWLRTVAEQGDTVAQFSLGERYYKGKDVATDRIESVKWFRKAFGACHYKGEGTTTDVNELRRAAKWYRQVARRVSRAESDRKAAKQEDKEAQYGLVLCYFLDLGIPESKEEAIEWYRKIVEQGHENAKERLPLLLRELTFWFNML